MPTESPKSQSPPPLPPNPKPQSPFDSLTPAQKEVGRKLLAEVSLDKLTVSYSIEERDINGRKTSAFYAATASRKVHESGEDNGAGFSFEEACIVKTFLSRHVVQETYDDAFRRKVIHHNPENTRERDAILASYDTKLAHVLSRVGSKPEPTE